MAYLEVLEGTWKELSAHAEEFRGRKLRLIVLPKEAEATEALTTRQRFVRRRHGCLQRRTAARANQANQAVILTGMFEVVS